MTVPMLNPEGIKIIKLI